MSVARRGGPGLEGVAKPSLGDEGGEAREEVAAVKEGEGDGERIFGRTAGRREGVLAPLLPVDLALADSSLLRPFFTAFDQISAV